MPIAYFHGFELCNCSAKGLVANAETAVCTPDFNTEDAALAESIGRLASKRNTLVGSRRDQRSRPVSILEPSVSFVPDVQEGVVCGSRHHTSVFSGCAV